MDFINGFHDAANSIATVVSTRVLWGVLAVVWASFFIYVAATCEIALAMALLVLLVRRRGTLDLAAGHELKG